jgi:hypothetical protein
MRTKRTINLAVPADLLDEFNEACRAYGHGKQKGMVLSAAMLMFLKADPRAQGRCLEEVLKADVADGVARMLDRARKEQGLHIAAGDADARAGAGSPASGDAASAPARQAAAGPARRSKKAAKKRGKPVSALKKLPQLKDR